MLLDDFPVQIVCQKTHSYSAAPGHVALFQQLAENVVAEVVSQSAVDCLHTSLVKPLRELISLDQAKTYLVRLLQVGFERQFVVGLAWALDEQLVCLLQR